ncbi:MAG: aldo/keto reductase, partial [Bacteroidota bacterium]
MLRHCWQENNKPMRYTPFGTTGFDISKVTLGTMTWGKQNTEAEGHAQMDYAVERGVNAFDTAELYAIPSTTETWGKTEEIIGTWFQATGARKDIVLATKVVGRSDMTWHRSMDVKRCRLIKDHIDDAVEGSLRRLQTDYIDLYQMHWPDRPAPMFGREMAPHEYEIPYEPFEDILDHLNSHVKAGKLRHIGVSNETPYGVMR